MTTAAATSSRVPVGGGGAPWEGVHLKNQILKNKTTPLSSSPPLRQYVSRLRPTLPRPRRPIPRPVGALVDVPLDVEEEGGHGGHHDEGGAA